MSFPHLNAIRTFYTNDVADLEKKYRNIIEEDNMEGIVSHSSYASLTLWFSWFLLFLRVNCFWMMLRTNLKQNMVQIAWTV